ncbi:HPF/RaiA family ribosome-associated protein [Chelatococcus sp. SYSU_G07232]|uniref:HPF/RaiA family ribosome-associated protein n=1 Tax=Chelatococcus albus TaxID=3047466 RepID=A0ABT7AFE1_9HYPH|nr:HPF/RaiA family ribosome-associated protein [Chelatococcus sp. SYSU_G07232]MDJ1158071.1 HPF/RaiA family ribosome-associated protein [Chelatococcus sp. SYSU_G07232]
METPPQIEFHGVDATDAVRETIDAQIGALEERFGRITACRVVLRGPGGRHRNGGLYEVNIWLSLPGGREVAVGRTPHADVRYADLAFALNDAFKRARRRLQDKVRRLQGQMKVHEAHPTATVARLEQGADFGFLETSDGRIVYFHRNSVLNEQFDRLKVGTRVAYVEEAGVQGPQASTVKRLGRHGMRP